MLDAAGAEWIQWDQLSSASDSKVTNYLTPLQGPTLTDLSYMRVRSLPRRT